MGKGLISNSSTSIINKCHSADHLSAFWLFVDVVVVVADHLMRVLCNI